MSETMVVHEASTAIVLVLFLSLPPILVATVVGVLVSLFQALTQIQEQTLGFAVKLIAVIVTIFATGPWLGAQIQQYTIRLFDAVPTIGY
jgi:type III secretion protein S